MISTTVGGADFSNGARNSGTVDIQLVKPHERKRSQKKVEEAIREALRPIPGIDVSLGQRPIFVSLMGPEPSVLETEIRVDFPTPQWAVTPGQSVVLYDGEACLGGGVIT